MAIGTVEGAVYTPPTDEGVLANIMGGIKAPLLVEGEVLDKASAFWASIFYTGVGIATGSHFGRKRAAQGQEPIAGFFF